MKSAREGALRAVTNDASSVDPASVIAAARQHALQRLDALRPGCADEINTRLLTAAATAAARGDYGIAAAVAIRTGGIEVLCIGTNAVFSTGDPVGHAEVRALAVAREVIEKPLGDLAGREDVLVRVAESADDAIVVYCTLEPCPVCAVALATAGVTEVVVALPDPEAGALLRPDSLAPVWRRLMHPSRMPVRVCQCREPGPTYVDPGTLASLRGVFAMQKGALTSRADAGGLLGSRLSRAFPASVTT